MLPLRHPSAILFYPAWFTVAQGGQTVLLLTACCDWVWRLGWRQASKADQVNSSQGLDRGGIGSGAQVGVGAELWVSNEGFVFEASYIQGNSTSCFQKEVVRALGSDVGQAGGGWTAMCKMQTRACFTVTRPLRVCPPSTCCVLSVVLDQAGVAWWLA